MISVTHWNYRLCTYVHEADNNRYYAIKEVHYNNDMPIAYQNDNDDPFNFIEGDFPAKSVEFTINAIRDGLEKPIIDLDNWPNEFLSAAVKEEEKND